MVEFRATFLKVVSSNPSGHKAFLAPLALVTKLGNALSETDTGTLLLPVEGPGLVTILPH